MPPFLATAAILCPRHCAPMASSCLPPPLAKRGHTCAGSMRWLCCKLPWEWAVPPQGSRTQLDAPRPQQRPPTSLKGQGVRPCWEGGCSSSEGGERCPPLFKSHLGEALAKHLPVPEGFPCEVGNVQRQPANPPETGSGN